MADKGRIAWIFLLLLLPLAFLWPNVRSGGVMLPLDILHHLPPFSTSVPAPLQQVHNPHLSDLVTIYYPWTELFRSGSGVPLWNPYSFCGSPLLANAQNGILFPLMWVWRIFPPGAASVALALAKLWFCGLFAFLFYCRTGFQPLSALLGSLGFMFGGHMVVWFGYPTSFPLICLPFLFWSLEAFIENPRLRHVAYVAIGFGLAFIGGQPQTAFLIGIGAVLFFAIRSRNSTYSTYRLWSGFVAAGILGLCLAAPQILPFVEYLNLSAAGRLRGSFGWKHYPWYTLISWIMPRFFGDLRDGNFWGFSSLLGEAVYVGSLPMVFATVGLVSSKRDSNFKATLAVFLFGCLGLYAKSLARFYLIFPLLANIDNNKLMALVSFGLISFAVSGADLFLTASMTLRKLFMRWCAAAIIWMVFLAVGFVYFRGAIRALGVSRYLAHEVCWLLGFLLTGVAILWLCKTKRLAASLACGLLLLATVADLFRVWISYYPSYPEKSLLPASQAVSYLQRNAGNHRIIGIGDLLPPETSALFRLQDVRGYDGMTPFSYYRVLEKLEPGIHDFWSKLHAGLSWTGAPEPGVWSKSTLFYRSLEEILNSNNPATIDALRRLDYWSSDISGFPQPSLLSILGVRYVLAPKGIPPPAEPYVLVYSSDAEVWENRTVLPRAFIVTRPEIVETDEQALARLCDSSFPFTKTALITAGPGSAVEYFGGKHGEGSLLGAEINRYDSEMIEIEASSPVDGWLILSDLYYPGWKAMVDSKPANILRGNYLFRAVQIPPGSHKVSFVFRPTSFRIGLILAFGAALTLVLLVFQRRIPVG